MAHLGMSKDKDSGINAPNVAYPKTAKFLTMGEHQ